jgi:cytochrome c553
MLYHKAIRSKEKASTEGTCVACHGQNAGGMLATNSPNLSGMRDSYLIAQIQKFRCGLRGANLEDVYGAQMAAMAKILPDEQAILDVVAYIVTLRSPSPKRTEMSGDPSQGKKIYEEQSCGQCHATMGQGMQGKGRPKYDSPRLAGQHDWYLIRQLRNFKTRVRGSSDNPASLLMRVQLVEFGNDQMFKDVAAYIGTFDR